MKIITRLIMLGLVIALVGGAAGLSAAQAQEELDTVRVGVIPVMIFSPLFVADARGYFAEEGIQIEISTNIGGSEPLAPLARQELDVVFGGTGAGLFNYAARNIETEGDPNFRIVAGAHSERPPLTSPLVVSAERFENGEITSVADLKGGRVAINAPGAATEYWMFKALEQGGLTFDDVELVAVAFPDVAAALNSTAEDRIDAAILGEPLASAVESQGLIKRLSTDFIEDFQPTFVYMSNDFLENKRDLAVGFVRALVRAYRDLQDPAAWSEEDVVAALTENTNGFSAELLDLYAFPQYEPDGTIKVEDIETLQTYFMEREQLAYDEPLDVADLLDTSILEDAIADLGEYEAEQ